MAMTAIISDFLELKSNPSNVELSMPVVNVEKEENESRSSPLPESQVRNHSLIVQ